MMNDIIDKILNLRGISDSEKEEFLSDSPKLTFDPFLIPDIDEGTDLILKHAKNGSKIVIYGDYDADGITATSLMYICLSQITDKNNISFIIPSRFEGGYGLNEDVVKQIKESGVDLLITVDCGSTSIKEVLYAKSLGLDVLVTDHHNIGEDMPDCLVINPKRLDSNYPFKELSGCGVSYKVMQVLSKKGYISREILTSVLDLVLIGTIGDIMPLVSENRTLVKYGLKVLKLNRRKGLKKLLESVSLDADSINSSAISYRIVPRLNAIGRVSDATEAVNLMLSEDDEEISKIVIDLNKMNLERQANQEEAYHYALNEVLDENGKCPNFIIIKIDNCNEGILGIVSGKIKDIFNRPTILLTNVKDKEGMYKGSGRSIEGINIYNLLNNVSNLFEKFGGHSQACGLTIDEKNIEELKKYLNSEIEELKKDNPEILKKKTKFDLEIETSDVNIQNANVLQKFEPCGKDNEVPTFKVLDVKFDDVFIIGKESQHLKLVSNGIDYIFFNKADNYRIDDLLSYQYDVIGTMGINEWKDVIKPQFQITDLLKKEKND